MSDTGMREIGAAAPVDLGAARTVIEGIVEYSYRRRSGATWATISASIVADSDGSGPHFSTQTDHLDEFWREMAPDGFCRCVRAGLSDLVHALHLAGVTL